jgi:hypothetical protein
MPNPRMITYFSVTGIILVIIGIFFTILGPEYSLTKDVNTFYLLTGSLISAGLSCEYSIVGVLLVKRNGKGIISFILLAVAFLVAGFVILFMGGSLAQELKYVIGGSLISGGFSGLFTLAATTM